MENKENRDIRVSAYMEIDDVLKLTQMAKNCDMSISQFVRKIILDFLEQQRKPE